MTETTKSMLTSIWAGVSSISTGALQTLGTVGGAANTGVQALATPAAQLVGGVGDIAQRVLGYEDERRDLAASLHTEGKYKEAFTVAWPWLRGTWKERLLPHRIYSRVIEKASDYERVQAWLDPDVLVQGILQYDELLDLSHLACGPSDDRSLNRLLLQVMALNMTQPERREDRDEDPDADDDDDEWVEAGYAALFNPDHLNNRVLDELMVILDVQSWYLRKHNIANYMRVESRRAAKRVLAHARQYEEVCNECAPFLATVRRRTEANEMVARRVFANWLKENKQHDLRRADVGRHIDGLCAYYFWVYANHDVVESMFVQSRARENY